MPDSTDLADAEAVRLKSDPGGTVERCPHCGSDRLAVRVLSWANYRRGRPCGFDREDIGYVEPIAGAEAVCRCCFSGFTIAGKAST